MAGLRQKLAAIAYALHPELRMASEPSRTHMVADLIGTLYAGPLALMGLIWLVAVTDLALLAAQWPLLLFLLALLFLFGRLTFNLYVELTRGTFFDWGGSLGTVVIWTGALIFGPTALWLPRSGPCCSSRDGGYVSGSRGNVGIWRATWLSTWPGKWAPA